MLDNSTTALPPGSWHEMMALRLPQPAQIRLRRGGVAAARRTVSIRPVRATAAPGGAKGGGDPQFRRRATPRAEPFTSSQDPLTEAATKATSRLAKGLNEQSRPPVSPTPAPKEDAEWEAWLEYFESCDRAMFMIDALQVRRRRTQEHRLCAVPISAEWCSSLCRANAAFRLLTARYLASSTGSGQSAETGNAVIMMDVASCCWEWHRICEQGASTN